MLDLFLSNEGSEPFVKVMVKVHPDDGLAIVIVEQDSAVRLGIAHDDAGRIDMPCTDRPHDMEAVDLLLGGHDAVIARRIVLNRFDRLRLALA